MIDALARFNIEFDPANEQLGTLIDAAWTLAKGRDFDTPNDPPSQPLHHRPSGETVAALRNALTAIMRDADRYTEGLEDYDVDRDGNWTIDPIVLLECIGTCAREDLEKLR